MSFAELISASKVTRAIEEQVKGSMTFAVINHLNDLKICARNEEAYKELSTVLKGVNVGMMKLDQKMKEIESELSEVKNEMRNMKDDIIEAIMDRWGVVSPT